MNFTKKKLKIIFLLFSSILFSQVSQIDSLRGSFIYLLQSKPDNMNKDYVYNELFSLQISDTKSFFISANRLKFDSIVIGQINKNPNNLKIDVTSTPKSKFKFLITQTRENIQFYENIGMTLLSYSSPPINTWKLINETKIINSISCKKAEVSYKGRVWTAWYSTDIPFPYGPYKFSGLPGLIVKITDKAGDYDFELVKSTPNIKLKGKIIGINKRHYNKAKQVTQKEMLQAKQNFIENSRHVLESMGTVFTQDEKEKQKRSEIDKNKLNPIELED
ncbi:GLPGLI family protein [Soonwooa sp.]|uniref:GLPGLI family protein n=1 Tax=Soonwooa sp. TaxID=1938592 RepID=UPI0028AF57E4|nr:GLPGLI family protein [Soonwooa sp.]